MTDTRLTAEQNRWLAETIARNRLLYGDLRMEAAGEGGDGGGDGSVGEGGGGQEQVFKQADVDRIVKDRVQREKAKYSDYDDLKAKAEGAKTLEDRLAELETKGTQSEQRALRAEIAGEFGISTKRGAKGEPSDAELFLTGTDEDTLRKQAERLAERESERKKNGNHVPGEGKSTPKPGEDKMRELTRNVFGRSD